MNKEDVKNIVRHVFHFYEENNKECNWTEMNEACCEVFKALDQKPVIEIPEGATYGDVFMAMFPDCEVYEHKYFGMKCGVTIKIILPDQFLTFWLPSKLWDTPYVKEGR